jgi:hypothetical protein
MLSPPTLMLMLSISLRILFPDVTKVVEGGIHEPQKVLEWKFVRLNALAEHSNMYTLEGAQFLLSLTRLP